jgi:hypothetical protein
MRTCPACGEDTEASYAEPCTECGVSATGEPATAPEPEPEPQVEPATEPEVEPAPEFEQPAPAPPSPESAIATGPEPPPEPPAEAPAEKKRSPARWFLWLGIVAAGVGIYLSGAFETPTGPDADQVEESIAGSAPRGVEITVDCPDDSDETPVGGTFTCTATGPNGRTVEIVVTNHEETFEWDTGPLNTLG